MEATWASESPNHEEYIIGGDIGGSNTNIAVVGRTGENYEIVLKLRFQSKDVVDFADTIQACFDLIDREAPRLAPSRCCICAAGPMSDNRCKPTNLDWAIDGDALSERFEIPFRVMNDFQAICYGVPLLDTTDPHAVLPVPHSDGTAPDGKGDSWAVAGAGTGLGVGYLTRIKGAYVSLPSEGGHTGFSPFDEETEALHRYVAERYDTAPGTELFLSGRGMAEIFKFFRDVKKVELVGALRAIHEASEDDIPPLITKHTPTDSGCRDIMKLFIKIYGHFASKVSLFYLPTGGMYIAGGIVVRHARLFMEDHNFMRAFENSYNPLMRKVLANIPVYIVTNYSISLLGAAHAAVVAPE